MKSEEPNLLVKYISDKSAGYNYTLFAMRLPIKKDPIINDLKSFLIP